MDTAPTRSLAIYDSMVAAIDRCYQVDEVKDIRDKALAFETYAKQAQNIEAERKAIEVRIRAERRAGQLLQEMERSPVSSNPKAFDDRKPSEPSEYAVAKKEANISENQAFRWQQLAAIPHETFERRLQDPLVKPTTSSLISNGDKPRQAPDDALALWGWLADFERKVDFNADVNTITAKLSDAVQSDVRRIVPLVLNFLGELE